MNKLISSHQLLEQLRSEGLLCSRLESLIASVPEGIVRCKDCSSWISYVSEFGLVSGHCQKNIHWGTDQEFFCRSGRRSVGSTTLTADSSVLVDEDDVLSYINTDGRLD